MVLCEASAIIICEWGGLVRHTCAVVCLSFALVVRRANKIWQTDWQRICVWSYGAWRRFTVPASRKEFKFIVNDMSLSKQRIPQSTDGTPKHSFRVSVCLFDSVRIYEDVRSERAPPLPFIHPRGHSIAWRLFVVISIRQLIRTPEVVLSRQLCLIVFVNRSSEPNYT